MALDDQAIDTEDPVGEDKKTFDSKTLFEELAKAGIFPDSCDSTGSVVFAEPPSKETLDLVEQVKEAHVKDKPKKISDLEWPDLARVIEQLAIQAGIATSEGVLIDAKHQ